MATAMRPLTRKYAVITFAALTLGIAAWIVFDYADPFNDAPFERTAWAASQGNRVAMARAAIDIVRPGISKDAVIELLGQADETYATDERAQYFGEHFPPSAQQTLVYWVGGSMRTSFLGLDDAFVYVHLDSEKVIAAEIGGG